MIRKTALLFCLLVFGVASAQAGDDPSIQGQLRADIQTAMKDYIAHQTVEDTLRCVERSRRNGVNGVNLDLMYGLPEQTEATFEATLDTVASHIESQRVPLEAQSKAVAAAFRSRVVGFDRPDELRAFLTGSASAAPALSGLAVIGLDGRGYRLSGDEKAVTEGDWSDDASAAAIHVGTGTG